MELTLYSNIGQNMNENRHQIEIDAEQDANSDVSMILWLAVGFALNIVGILIAYIYQQSPPATRTFEKSQEYVLFYTEAYKAKSRSLQIKYSVIGLLFAIAMTFILVLIYLAVMFVWYERVRKDFY